MQIHDHKNDPWGAPKMYWELQTSFLRRYRNLEYNEEVLILTCSSPQTTRAAATSRDFTTREKALAKREQEFKRKSELLDEQLSNVSKKEQKASDMIEKCETKAAEATLALLDEHFTCSL
jgi:hypothetical protein